MRYTTERSLGILVLVLSVLVASEVRGDFRVSGQFLYKDRELDESGFTGVEPDRPIRLAEVQVIDAQTNELLASSHTDREGRYDFAVADSRSRDLRVRVLSRATLEPSLKLEVLHPKQGAVHALAAPELLAHEPTAEVTGVVVTSTTTTGGAFNIFDNLVDLVDYVAQPDLAGARPAATIRGYWGADANQSGAWAYPGSRALHIGDVLAYDDTIVLHEAGHIIHALFSRNDELGGAHYLGDNFQDLRLAFGEGVATYLCAATRRFRGDARPDVYVQTTGGAGKGNLSFSYGFEANTVGAAGAACEVAVTQVLWDLVDDAASLDDSPGTDDDPVQVPDGDARVWRVLTRHLKDLEEYVTLDTFWDGWSSPGLANGLLSEVTATFRQLDICYERDSFEAGELTTPTSPLILEARPRTTGPTFVITDVYPERTLIVLRNTGTQPVSLAEYSARRYDTQGKPGWLSRLPADWSIQPGGGISTWGGAPGWKARGPGAFALFGVNPGDSDFVRWGASAVSPPPGTAFTGVNPASPTTDERLSRDVVFTDTNDGSDWHLQSAFSSSRPMAPTSIVQMRSLYPSGDVDTILFEAHAGHEYTVELVQLLGQPEPEAGMIDPKGAILDATSVLGSAEVGKASFLFAPRTAGIHRLQVRHRPLRFAGGTFTEAIGKYGSYGVRLLTEPTQRAIRADSVRPTAGSPGQRLVLTAMGDNFGADTRIVVSGEGIEVGPVTVESSNLARADIALSAHAPLGARDVTVSRGLASSTLRGAFAVLATTAAPSLLLNELNVARSYVELVNVGQAPVDLSGWSLVRTESNGFQRRIRMTSRSVSPGAFTTWPLNPGFWPSGSASSLALEDSAATIVDFVAWGHFRAGMPWGARFSGEVPPAPRPGLSLGRNSRSDDGDSAADWSTQPPTPGAANLAVSLPGDDHPDRAADTRSPADTLALDRPPAEATFEVTGDVDVYRIDLEAGHTYDFSSWASGAGSLDLRLVGPGELATLARSTGADSAQLLAQTVQTTGTHFLAVASAGSGCPVTYVVRCADISDLVGPIARIQPPNLDFGEVPPGGTSERQFTLFNRGATPLAVRRLFTPDASFQVLRPLAPLSVPAGGTATVTVLFVAGSRPGTSSTTLTVASNSVAAPELGLSLTAVTAAAALRVSTWSVTFGEVEASQCQVEVLTLTNAGTAPFSGQAAILGTTSVALEAGPATTQSTSIWLAAGASCTLRVRLCPRGIGPIAGLLSLTGNGVNLPLFASLSGMGTSRKLPPGLTVNPEALDFGAMLPTREASRVLRLYNPGEQVLLVRDVQPSDRRFTVSPPGELSLAPGDSRDFTVGFRSDREAGPVHGLLVIASNAPSAVTTVALSARVLAADRPPVAEAGDELVRDVGPRGTRTVIVLDGRRSCDPDGDLLGYHWHLISSSVPGALLASAIGACATLVVTRSGVVEVGLAVVSGSPALRSTDSVSVLVLDRVNRPPSASAGLDRTVTVRQTTVDTRVQLLGRGSMDPDGAPAVVDETGQVLRPDLDFHWREAAPGPAGLSARFLSPANGTWVERLDGNGADAGFVDPEVRLRAAGVYTFHLRVNEASGERLASPTTTVRVTVLHEPPLRRNTAPRAVARIVAPRGSIRPPGGSLTSFLEVVATRGNAPQLTLAADGLPPNGSSDRETPCSLLKFAWTQVEEAGFRTRRPPADLSDAASPRPRFTPTDYGLYRFQVQVLDDGRDRPGDPPDETAPLRSLPSAEVLVLFRPPDNEPPRMASVAARWSDAGDVPRGRVSFTKNRVTLSAGGFPRVELTATATDDDETEALTYHWRQVRDTSTAPPVAVDSSPQSSVATFWPQASGTYEFEVTASDGQLESVERVQVPVDDLRFDASTGRLTGNVGVIPELEIRADGVPFKVDLDRTRPTTSTRSLEVTTDRVILDASRSVDGASCLGQSPRALAFEWTQSSGPQPLPLTTASVQVLDLATSGVYELMCSIHDGRDSSTFRLPALKVQVGAVPSEPTSTAGARGTVTEGTDSGSGTGASTTTVAPASGTGDSGPTAGPPIGTGGSLVPTAEVTTTSSNPGPASGSANTSRAAGGASGGGGVGCALTDPADRRGHFGSQALDLLMILAPLLVVASKTRRPRLVRMHGTDRPSHGSGDISAQKAEAASSRFGTLATAPWKRQDAASTLRTVRPKRVR